MTADTERAVPTRRISFAASLEALPKYFAGDGDLIMSHVLVSLSTMFPDGEDFFVRSVRRYRDEVTEPELKRDVAGFIGQESVHGREHRALNERLHELGYPAKRMEAVMRWVTKERRFDAPIFDLASTAAFEHFTATLAEKLLTDATAREAVGDGAVHDVLVWHALEESEHKAVAFDVYRTVGGSERMRRVAMNLSTFVFLFLSTTLTLWSLAADRNTYRPRVLLRSLRGLRRSPFLTPDMWRTLRAYNRKGFHPNDFDTTELIPYWRAQLFGPEGELKDNLLSSSAA
jgi:predicted metal-dependent hydrolase